MIPTESGEGSNDKKCLLGNSEDKKIKRVNYESWWSRTKDWAKKLVEGEEGQRDKAGKYRRLQ